MDKANKGRRSRGSAVLVGGIVAALISAATAARADEHLAEHAPPSESAVQHSPSLVHYAPPDVRLIRDDGKAVRLADEMDDGRAVVLNFIFTSCGSTCPLMSAMLSQFQQKLGGDMAHVHLMSISIDPEEDTPSELRKYAHKFHAGAHWQHYTGSVEASLAVQRAFNVWRGDKMSHAPVTFMRLAPGQPWLRIEGFVLPEDLVQDYHTLQSKATPLTAASAH